MYESSSSGNMKKNKLATSYLVRPRLGALRSLYGSRSPTTYVSAEKRKKMRKSPIPKMEFRRKPDYADTAYREAVSRLRILLAESYTPIKRPLRELDSAGEETDNQSLVSAGSRNSRLGRSYYNYYPMVSRRYLNYPPLRATYATTSAETEKNAPEPRTFTNQQPELMDFIERQEKYIEQLEKESTFCREELASLLSKVKDVISENEHLHEKQKNKLIKSVFEQIETETETENEYVLRKSPARSKKSRIIEGPSIVFESRISELEAQLTQAKIDLRKAQEENEEFKKRGFDEASEPYRKQMDKVQKEKDALQESVNKLQNVLSKLRDKENETCDQVKRSLDVAEQAQYEKSSAEIEIRRLKDELERQHSKLRDAISDQSRRIADERSAVERRYAQQVEQLNAELSIQWESTNKLQLELDKQRRENTDLRREIAQKQSLIDELKKDMQNKIINLQSDIGVSGAEKSALEQQISTLQMANERTERQYKQEITRLQAEMQSLRQRTERADADLIHSRRENLRLNEQVASLEKEINLNAALSEERSKSAVIALPPPKVEERDKEIGSMIKDMENKHAATVAELEGMIHSQNQLMGKLSTECQGLTQKLEDANRKHKEEIQELQTKLDGLDNRFCQSQLQSSSYTEGNNNGQVSAQHTENEPNNAPNANGAPVEPDNYSQYYKDEQYSANDPNQQYTEPGTDLTDQQQYLNQEQYDEMYQNDSNQYYQGDPNQEYQADPNQEYQTDPNQEYAADPNQTYDPNAVYDPNMQYSENPEQPYADPDTTQPQEKTEAPNESEPKT